MCMLCMELKEIDLQQDLDTWYSDFGSDTPLSFLLIYNNWK